MIRGIRYRAGRSFVVFLLATTAAVLAPAYSRAAQQSVLADGLTSAAADATSLTVGARGTADGQPSAYTATDEIRLSMNQVLAREPALAQRLDSPVGAVDTDVSVAGGTGPVTAKLAYRDHACDHLAITGACPEDAGQVVISQRMAAAHGYTTGGSLTVHLGPPTGGRDRVFKITGLYSPKDAGDGYWGRTVYFAEGGGGAGGDT